MWGRRSFEATSSLPSSAKTHACPHTFASLLWEPTKTWIKTNIYGNSAGLGFLTFYGASPLLALALVLGSLLVDHLDVAVEQRSMLLNLLEAEHADVETVAVHLVLALANKATGLVLQDECPDGAHVLDHT